MVVLDVFIGLVLVYFLYSLLVSILAELVSTWIGMRARILRQGIDHFLNDKLHTKEGFWEWLHDIFMVEHKSFNFTNAGKFYTEPTIKYLAKVKEQGRFSIRNTKPSYIEKNHFVTAILSMLMRRSIGINDWDKVKFAIETNSLNLEKETHQMFQDWLALSNDNYEKFKAFIGNSFEEVNDRLVGWYKRKIGLFLFVIGFILSVSMNVDTFEIVQILANNSEIRKEMAALAIATVDKEESTKKVNNAYEDAKSSIEKASNILGAGWEGNDKPWHPFSQKFWGFIITAFALSMGSKFWFDLLKRLVALRGAGVKPEERDSNKTKGVSGGVIVPENSLQMNTSDPAIIALSQNRKTWEAQPGFVAANVEYEKNNTGFIKLIFVKERVTTDMPKSIPNPIDNAKPEIVLKYKKGTKGDFKGGDASEKLIGSISQSTTNSSGTPAGVAYDPRTDSNVILTAGHVVRNDKTSFIDTTKSKVSIFLFDSESKENKSISLGEASNLVLSSFCDAGIIKVNEGFSEKIKGLPKLNNIRDVTFVDKFRTDVEIHTLRGERNDKGEIMPVEGRILNTKVSYGFDDHPSTDIRFYDLFLIGDRAENYTNPLTLGGDSGALITDVSGNQIGILVGAVFFDNQNFSFGIKLKDIFEILQLEPAKNEKKYNFYLEPSAPDTSSA